MEPGTSPAGQQDAADCDLAARVAAVVVRVLSEAGPGAGPLDAESELSGSGLDSMTAARLWLAVQDECAADVPLGWLAEAATIGEYARRVAAHTAEQAAPEGAGATGAKVVAAPDARHEPFPLTPLQEAYLIGKEPDLQPDAVGCHLYREFDVPALDTERLRAAWQRLVEHHDMLRATVTADGRQRISERAPRWELAVHESADRAGFTETARAVRARMSHHLFAADDCPPFAIEVTLHPDGTGRIHFGIDAMITDGQGLDLLTAQWEACYTDPSHALPAPTAELSVRDCVVALDAARHTETHRRDLDHWVETLRELPGAPSLFDDAAPERGDGLPCVRRSSRTARLSPTEWSALRARAEGLGVSPTSLVLTVFTEALARHGAHEPYSVVVTTSMRPRLPADADHLVGPFTATTFVEAVLPGLVPFEEAARRTHEELWQALEHSSVCGVSAQRALRARNEAGPGPLPVVFTSMLDAAGRPRARGFGAAPVYAVSQTTGVWLDHQMWEQDGALHLRWDTADACFVPGTVDAAFASLCNGLRAAAVEGAVRERPMNDLQQAYFVPRATAEPGLWRGCQVVVSYEAGERVDAPRLESAVVRLMEAYDVLRSAVTEDGVVAVRERAPRRWAVPVVAAVCPDAMREAMAACPFPLGRHPQFEVRVVRGEGGDTVLLAVDLTLADARSIHLIGRELMRLYTDPSAQPRPPEPLPDVAEEAAGRARAHWRDELRALPPGLPLPAPREADAPERRVRVSGAPLALRPLAERCAEHGLSLDAVLLTAFTDVLARRFGTDFAVPVVRWDHGLDPQRPGELTALSWLPCAPRELSFTERARGYDEGLARDAAVTGSGLPELRRAVARTGSAGYPVVYTCALDFTDRPLPTPVRAGQWLSCTPDVFLDCITTVDADRLQLAWDAVDGRAPEGGWGELHAEYHRAVARLAEDEGAWRESAADAAETAEGDGEAVVRGAELHKILHEWNDTARPFDGERLMHRLFEERAAEQPEAEALRWRDGTMTYQELNRRANRIATRLTAEGVGPETVVAVSVERGPMMVAVVLGVLKAGGVYLPMEPHLPAERAAVILEEAQATAVVTTAGRVGWPVPDGYARVCADAAVEGPHPADADTDPQPVAQAHNTAYIIFTSGSTGRPKGVAVAHRPVANLLDWCYRTFRFGPGDMGLCVTSLGFDLSVFDVFGLLGAGGALYIADAEQQRDPALLLDVLIEEPVTFWNSAPTTLAQVGTLLDGVRGTAGTGDLRLVFLSGDYTPLSLPDEVRATFPRADLISLGGATEATVWSNWFRIGPVDPAWRSIPYGKPIDNCRYHVLDERLRPCPVGVEGDLYIGGECLALGYVNQPELTADRFIPDPFHDDPQERLYKTGDRALYYPDGNLSFQGRADGQVKIRGFRVELAEIEHRLRAHEAVKEAVVLAREDGCGDRTLVAYVVARPGAAPSARDLRGFAGQTLPEYMVPNFIGFLAGFPATANGKLDRAALPWPLAKEHLTPPAADGSEAVSDAPSSEPAAVPAAQETGDAASVRSYEQLCEEIAGLFAQALGVEAVDPDTDVWDQGATSFTMVRVSGALQRSYRKRFPVSALLDNPSVAAIARWVHTQLGGDAEPSAGPRPAATAGVRPPADTAPEPVAQDETPRPPAAAGDPPRPEAVDFFAAEERERFKRQHWNRRADEPELPEVTLPDTAFEDELYAWRASRRDFLEQPVPHRSFARLLGLLREAAGPGGTGALYPSAGDTYSVQVYLHLTPDAVEGLDAGLYYYDPARHTLRLLRPGVWPDRGAHFYYNRPVFDRSRFGIYLFGQRHGIEPLYADEALRYLTLEAGYMGQLLMLGQAAHGVGLCPIGALNTEQLGEWLGLDEGHVFLQAFLGGAAPHPGRTAGGTPPFFAEPAENPGATPAATTDAPAAAATDVQTAAAVGSPAAATAEPTAVIGMAGRFPGAADLAAFWDNLVCGRTAIAAPPASRPETAPAGARAVGGFLPHIDRFDSLHFHVSPQEAPSIDPQARLMLETVWQCLDDAGHTADSLRTSAGRVGVFIGSMWHDYRQQGADRWHEGDTARVPAAASDIANRISHFFDFRGPSLTVDTSCSSSFAALHLAVESLRRGECGAAVVGAVNLLAHPYHWALLDGLELLAADAPPAAYAAESSGWHPGEGVGVVLLRPAGAARRAQDTVHGLVEGTRLGHAGRAPRYGAPRTEALADSIARALADASVIPDEVDYVECAAAGAGIADAAELEALGSVLARCAGSAPVPVGTLKPNIGHLEAASGLSQLIKALLQIRHGRIAPTRVAGERSPLVDFDGLPVELADTPRPLLARAADGRATVLVNAVGATGSYGHVVLRAPYPHGAGPAAQDEPARTASPSAGGARTVVLSAATPEALSVAAGRLRDHLAAGGAPSLDDLAWTLQTGRAALRHRLTLTADGLDGVRAGLTAYLDGRPYPGLASAAADPALADVPTDARDMARAAADWLRGHAVDFARLWSEPARRIPLPVHVFAPVRHWLAAPAPRRTDEAPLPVPAPADPRPAAPTASARSGADGAQEYVTGCFADVSGIGADRLHPRVPLEHYGLNSHLVARFNERLRQDVHGVSSTILFEYADLAGVAAHLAAHHEGPWSVLPAAPAVAAAPAPAPAPVVKKPDDAPEPIAVIGIAGRYPGARDLDAFWSNLVGGVDSVGPLPAERAREGWPTERMWGGFLDGVDRFDALFFQITPRDAQLMDPQERQFLEVAWETLEDAGCTRSRIKEQLGSDVGVFVGTMYNEYPFFGVERSQAGEPCDTGSAVAGIANRVSYFLDLHGPSLAVDTMCSSSLTALHLAVESLRRGECAAALAGGVNLSLHPHKFRQQDRLKMASSDHRCRSFGAGGDGFVPAEGVGAVLLKPLSAAEADGDRIHAVIRGTAVNHGGRTNGYMVPNPVAQGELVRAALRRAGAEPATIGYLEAHGTGTQLGDPVEINGLNRAFADASVGPASRAIGSVKSNIGHAEAAAGIAGLTKVILQLRHRRLVPSLHADELNPAVDWAGSPFELVREERPWAALTGPDGAALPRRAGISAFGAGGANAHVVVEEYAAPEPAALSAGPSEPEAQLIVVSAHDLDRLQALAGRLRDRLGRADRPAPALADVAHTLQSGREPLRERFAVVAHDVPGLCRALDRFASGDTGAGVHGRTPGGHLPDGPLAVLDPAADRDAELLRLARHWTGGGTVDWASLHTARRRLVALPSYPFAGNRHWLPEPAPTTGGKAPLSAAAPAAEPAPATGTAGEFPPVLYGRTWRALTDLGDNPLPPGRVVCVFGARSEPVARAVARLLGPERVLLVRAGADAGDGVPGLADEAAADAFARGLSAEGPGAVGGLIDLADLGRSEREGPGAFTTRLVVLRRLVRALRGHGGRVLHVTEGLYGPTGAGSLAGARLAGFVRMLTAEYGRVAGTVLDLDVSATGPDTAARRILAEYAERHGPSEVSVRGGVRHRADLVALPDTGHRPLRLDADRAYLVTGGTRGIGARVARFLVSRGARRIALTGVRPLPARTHWPLLEPGSPEARTAALVGELEDLGARVLVHAGPLSERDRTDRFLRRVRDELGPIGGVVHCAGRGPAGRPSFIGKDMADFDPVLEPKTTGLEVLDELCAGDRPEFFVLFSSLSAVAPGLAAGVLDYAAANAFLDCYAEHRVRSGRPWFRSIAWPTWSESGMGAERPDSCAPVGVGPLGDEAGLRTLERVLALPAEQARVVACPPLDGVPPDPEKLLGHPHGPGATDAEEPAAASAADVTAELSAPAGSAAHAFPTGDARPLPTEEEHSVAHTPVTGPPWLASVFSELLAIPEEDLDPTAPLGDLGVESVLLGEILLRLEDMTGLTLDPATLLDHPTLELLGRHLLELGVPAAFDGHPAPAAHAAVPASVSAGAQPAAVAVTAPAASSTGPDLSRKIAVVGLSCRFPGAADAAAFQRNLLAGVCSVTEVPAARWDVGELYRPEPEPGRSISKWGGFLDGIEDFDPEWFGMNEDEARCLDPAVRLFLEGAAGCLADAGYAPQELAGRDVGVFAGARLSHYNKRVGDRRGLVGMGSDQNFIAARVAHHFDLHGPNLVVDSACSSSLVALQLACRSLLDGESELALAGGVDVLLDEEPYLDFSAAKALSRNGRCATFDEGADGFVPGEGCGIVLLKPLESALRDGNRVHAVLDAVAVNNDGRTMGLTTPNPAAQAKVVRRALAAAGRGADELGLIEAHGTGTMIGDPIELRALTDVFREETQRTGFCAIGSVKTNVGHLLSAAGMAGLIKAVLAVRDGHIAPTLFCERPNPRFDFAASPFYPSRAARDWVPEPGRVRVAGVSAFGLGGTNAHAVVSQLDPALAAAHRPRPALPAPVFQRRRLWLEAPRPTEPPATATVTAPAPAPAITPAADRPPLGASILGLSFEEPSPLSDSGYTPLTPTGAGSTAAPQEGRKW
ncbi:amino acid adenylation domain-containing protein [Streptomyces sp. NPDC012466]|uniref:amino acid adenylation domain-containing protein n=1 Tax=Streptomyces sp. NPDC012466 TaxID=3364835 RepID=UPI0036EB01B0